MEPNITIEKLDPDTGAVSIIFHFKIKFLDGYEYARAYGIYFSARANKGAYEARFPGSLEIGKIVIVKGDKEDGKIDPADDEGLEEFVLSAMREAMDDYAKETGYAL